MGTYVLHEHLFPCQALFIVAADQDLEGACPGARSA